MLISPQCLSVCASGNAWLTQSLASGGASKFNLHGKTPWECGKTRSRFRFQTPGLLHDISQWYNTRSTKAFWNSWLFHTSQAQLQQPSAELHSEAMTTTKDHKTTYHLVSQALHSAASLSCLWLCYSLWMSHWQGCEVFGLVWLVLLKRRTALFSPEVLQHGLVFKHL